MVSRAQSHFSELIAADDKILSRDGEAGHDTRNAFIVQRQTLILVAEVAHETQRRTSNSVLLVEIFAFVQKLGRFSTSKPSWLLAKEMLAAINELMLCKDEETNHQKSKECFSQLIRRRSQIKTERTSEANENTNQELSRTSEANDVAPSSFLFLSL